MPEELQNMLGHILNALPAVILFIIGFVWHTRTLLANLQDKIKEALGRAEAAEGESKKFHQMFLAEQEQRRDMGISQWDEINKLKNDLVRLEERLAISQENTGSRTNSSNRRR